MFRQLFAPVLRLAWHVMVRLTPDGDPWERLNVAPRLHMYGGGSRREFSQYLTGPSRVAVSSLGAIQDWLLDCRYETDETLFAEPDFWQHPTTFEHLRAGDCEDFSLWAWRKLVESSLMSILLRATASRTDSSQVDMFGWCSAKTAQNSCSSRSFAPKNE